MTARRPPRRVAASAASHLPLAPPLARSRSVRTLLLGLLAGLAALIVAAPAMAATDHTAYVANSGSNSVTPIDTQTNAAGTTIAVGSNPIAVAITPDGATAYVANPGSNNVTPIDTATNTAGTAIAVGSNPLGIAITPDGATAYAVNQSSNSVTPIDTATNTAGTAIAVGSSPFGIAITPDGATAYVANQVSNSVTPIDTATNTAGTPIAVGSTPRGVAITPDGATAYVANLSSNSVTPIDTATNTAGTPIAVGTQPFAVAITPDGATAYAVNNFSHNVTPIDTATNTAGTAIAVGNAPRGIAVTPDQAPTAAFTATPAPAGSATSFDASSSSASAGQTVASYHWDFGDGSTQTTSSATTAHTYDTAGNHTATLTVTDDAGCSTDKTFTGQTVSCNGSGAAQISHQVTIAAASPTLSTSASDNITIGHRIRDTAKLSGGVRPTGTITFRLYGPGDSNCSGAPAFTDTQPVSGNGGYPSARFAPTEPGVYYWKVSYSGDADNDPGSKPCNSPKEKVWVQKASPTLDTEASLTAGGRIVDTATVAHGHHSSGEIAFKLYAPGDTHCSEAPVFGDRVPVSGNGSYRTQPYKPRAPGTYRFTASLPSDASNRAAHSPCNAARESVTVSKR
jgi:YVTN family beta-propeller protein